MSWRLRDRPLTVKVTKKIAKEFAEMDPAPHDRPLSERRLQVYERMWEQGLLRPVTWAKAWCPETNGMYRVNGKHTSTLLSGKDVLPEFYVTIEVYVCDTLEDVAKLYATFDSRIQSRTSRDINLSFAATIPALKDVNSTTINLAVIGMGFHLYGLAAYQKQAAERAELLMEHPEFVCWLQEMEISNRGGGKISKSAHISRGPVIAGMFATWLKSQTAAQQFWTAVRDETGSSPNLPDRKLAKYLTSYGVDNARGAQRSRRAAPREMYVKCLHAWNAWRKGEQTDMKYFADKDIPPVR